MCESRGGRPGLPSLRRSLWTESNIELELEILELRSCLKVEVAVLGYQSLLVLNMVSMDDIKVQRSCFKVEVAVLGYRSVLVLLTSVDLKQH